MMTTMTRTEPLVLVVCYKCGVNFGMAESYYHQRKRHQDVFSCPNGHSQHFTGPTEADRLRDELAREKRLRESANIRLDAERDQRLAAECSNRALRGAITKTKRRIGNGVCPCCNRHFVNVERHMETQHPEYAKSGAEA